MKKKVTCLFLVLSLVFCITGCSTSKPMSAAETVEFTSSVKSTVPTVISETQNEENKVNKLKIEPEYTYRFYYGEYETPHRYVKLTTQQKMNITSFDDMSSIKDETAENFMNFYHYEFNPYYVENQSTCLNYLYNAYIPMMDTTQCTLYECCTYYEVNYYLILGLIEELSIFDNDYVNPDKNTIGYFQLPNKLIEYYGEVVDVGNADINIWLGIEDFMKYYDGNDIETTLDNYAEGHGYDSNFTNRVMQYAYAWGYGYESSSDNELNKFIGCPYVIIDN